MRSVKALGLVTVIAMLAAASVGVGMAAAVTELEKVVVCKLDVSTCPSTEDFASGIEIFGELVPNTSAVLLTSVLQVLCEESAALGHTTALLAHGSVEAVLFEQCHQENTIGCTVKVTESHLPFLASALLNTAHNGYHVVVSSGGHGQPEAHVSCPLLNCTFGASEILFEVLLEAHHTTWDVLQSLSREGGLCPSTSTWHAKYLVHCLTVGGGTEEDCWPAME